MKSCPYCKNKTKNVPLVETKDAHDGLAAQVIRSNEVAYLAVDGWYGGCMGIEPELVPINYCPACGRNLVERGE